MKKALILLVILSVLAAFSCKDPGGEGTEEELTLSVSDGKTSLTGRLDTARLTASNGTAPYKWSLSGQGKGLLLSATTGESVLVSVSQDAVITPEDTYSLTLEDSASPANTKSYTFKIADIQSELYALQVEVEKDSTAGEIQYVPDVRTTTITNFQEGESITINIAPNADWAEGLALFNRDHLNWVETTPSQMVAGGLRFEVNSTEGSLQLILDSSLSAGGVDGIYTLTYDDGAILTGALAMELTFTVAEGVVLVDQNGLNALVGRDAVSALSVVGGMPPYTWVVKDSAELASDDIVLEEADAGDTSSQSVSLKTDGDFTHGSEYTVYVTDDNDKESSFVYTLEDISTYGLVLDMNYAGSAFDFSYDTTDHRGVISTGAHDEVINMTLAPNDDWTNRGFVSFDQDNITWEETTPLALPAGGGVFEVIDGSQAKVTLKTNLPIGTVDGEYSFTYHDGDLELTGNFFLSGTANPLAFTGGLAHLSGSSATDTLLLGGGIGPFTWSVLDGTDTPSTALILTGGTDREKAVSVSPATIVPGTYKVKVVDNYNNDEIEHTYSLYADLVLDHGGVFNLIKDVTEQASLTISGGAPPYVWTILDDSNNPSTGLVLSGDNGDLTRTVSLPSANIIDGVYTVKVEDSVNAVAIRTYYTADSLAVTGPSILVGTNSISMAITGGLPPYSWRILKDGGVTTELSLGGQGTNSVRALSQGTGVENRKTYQIEATDANGTVVTYDVTYYTSVSFTRNTGSNLKGKSATSRATALTGSGSGSYSWSISRGKRGDTDITGLKISSTGGTATTVSLKSASTHRAGDIYTLTLTDTVSADQFSMTYTLQDSNYGIFISSYYLESKGKTGLGSGRNTNMELANFSLTTRDLALNSDTFRLVISPRSDSGWATGDAFYDFGSVLLTGRELSKAINANQNWGSDIVSTASVGGDSVLLIVFTTSFASSSREGSFQIDVKAPDTGNLLTTLVVGVQLWD